MSKHSDVQRQLIKNIKNSSQKNDDEILANHDADKMPSKKYVGDGPVFSPTAASGSGEFHLYKIRKRNEQEAEEIAIEQEKKLLIAKQFEEERIKRAAMDELKTEKNRRRRLKRCRPTHVPSKVDKAQ